MIVTSYKQMELTPADVWNFAGLIGFAVRILQRVHMYLRGFGLVYLCIWQIQKVFLRLLFLNGGISPRFQGRHYKSKKNIMSMCGVRQSKKKNCHLNLESGEDFKF